MIELDTRRKRDRPVAELMLQCIDLAFKTSCPDLTFEVHKIDVADIQSDIAEAAKTTRVHASECVVKLGATACVYIAPRGLIVMEGGEEYNLTTYLVATATARGTLNMFANVRGDASPLAAESARRHLAELESLFAPVRLSDEETNLIARFRKCFKDGIDMLEAAWERRHGSATLQ